MRLTRESKITGVPQSVPVQHAADILRRDIQKVLIPAGGAGAELRLQEAKYPLHPEGYVLTAQPEDNALLLTAGDVRGFIYGLLEISRRFLGVQPFWFWNDQQFVPQASVDIPEDFCLESAPFAVKRRGWFVNDEVLIHAWKVDRRAERPWEMVFEALLRCGGNMVIPGTDRNSKKYRDLAAGMGLIITHHHAEPLGAEMFARAYPELLASYAEYPEKFRELWERALEEQAGCEVVWNLGFRGQGDRPFWEDDPRYATPEARGELMGRLIREQYQLVQDRFPGAVCATNLYGETMELYRDGYLQLPDEIIKIWADNGFGAMVSRRQGNHNPRVPALPDTGDTGAHGIYYHASFYDLQAANHITMLPNSPELVIESLRAVLNRNMTDYWIVNCSNVKPHVFTLDLIARLWREGKVTVEEQLHDYCARYYGAPFASDVAACFKTYYQAALPYGPNRDDHAGEQFSNYVPRMLVNQYMRDRNLPFPDLLWATAACSLGKQAEWCARLCQDGQKRYSEALSICRTRALHLPEAPRRLLEDSVLLQIQIYCHCYKGAALMCQSLLEALDEKYQQAFYHAGLAWEEYTAANTAMREREHGQWNEAHSAPKTGVIWFFALLLRRFLDFFRANLLLLAGVLPGVLLTIWGIWGHSLPVTLLGARLADWPAALSCADCTAPSCVRCVRSPASGLCPTSVP